MGSLRLLEKREDLVTSALLCAEDLIMLSRLDDDSSVDNAIIRYRRSRFESVQK